MGLREKVALIRAVIIFIQIFMVSTSPKDQTLKSKRSSDGDQEAIRKMFNFPEVEYPTASTPRTHFYLQESNVLQKNEVPRPAEIPSSIPAQYSNMKNSNKKYNNPTKFKTKNSGIKKSFPEIDTISKPYSYGEKGVFPEVEYPLTAWETWRPNNWKEMASYVPKHNVYDNDLNSVPKVDSKLKLGGATSSKLSGTSAANKKSITPKKTNVLNTTPAPDQDSTKSTAPYVLTPYTTSYFDTTPSYNDILDENKDTTPGPKETTTENRNNINNDSCINSGLSPNDTTLLPQKEPSNNGKLKNINTWSNMSNERLSIMCVATTTPSYLRNDDHRSISPFTLYNDNKTHPVSCDNKVASITDTGNTEVTENRDNNYLCVEDNVKNSNKSSIYDVDEEFTTDVFPDFDVKMLSVIAATTSTMSPMSLAAIEDAWDNSDIIDPYKSLSYTDELDQYYIAVP